MSTVLDWVPSNVCLSEALTTSPAGLLQMAPWAYPRLVVDELARTGGDGRLSQTTALPGKLMLDKKTLWKNATPLEHMIRIVVTRGTRSWVTSNPNAIEIRDRWSTAVDADPVRPTVTGYSNGKCGSAIDLETNSVGEPNPGRHWCWQPAGTVDEWVGPLMPGETLKLWYQCYAWTPPPFADNANSSSLDMRVAARFSRVMLWAYPRVERAELGDLY